MDKQTEDNLLKLTEGDLRLKYRDKIAEVGRVKSKSIVIKHSDLVSNLLANLVVYKKLVADKYIKDCLINIGLDEQLVWNLQIRYVGLPSDTSIRNLKSEFVGQTRSFEGIVRRVSEVKSKATTAIFECTYCTARVSEEQKTSITYPEPKCKMCGKIAKWKVVPEGGTYTDFQTITVQEFPEGIRSGEQPKSISVILTGDICGVALPGNRVTLCGVLKLKQIKNENGFIFEPFVDGNSVVLKDETYENIVISDEELKQITELSANPNVLNTIASSIAPTIYGNEEVKRGIALQLFGGVPKTIGTTRIRGDIHILLIGDPGIAKSVIMKHVVDISPRGIFTHGYSASKAGLTATAVKEDDQWVLEAGALVLADQGLCAVDELDKMGDIDRESLHGAMEQQEIDIAKAGIVAKLLTRCSLLGAANPKLGRFDLSLPLAQQFNLAPTLVSRFDLIYPMTDTPEAERDDEIATHILNTHTTQSVGISALSVDLLRKYIAHAKTINPRLTKEATTIIKQYYTKVRALANNMHTVPITARSLEALIRLSEASARMRLSQEVSPDDAKLVVSIVDGCLRQIAYDAKTDVWDIDRVVNRYPKKMRDMFARITDAVIQVSGDGGVASVKDVLGYLKNRYGINEDEALAHIEAMKQETRLIYPKEGLVKVFK
jgi:replicative DNA helicase Mcm